MDLLDAILYPIYVAARALGARDNDSDGMFYASVIILLCLFVLAVLGWAIFLGV